MIGPLEGFLVDRFGPRKMMLLGVPLIAVGFYLLSRLEDITALTGWDALILFYTIYVLGITLGSSLGTGMAANTAVANWFIRRRGMALGILSAGVGIGAGLWVPVIGMVLARTSWEQASVFAAFLVLIVGIPAAFVMRHRPEDYGYLPDGETRTRGQTQPRPTASARRPGRALWRKSSLSGRRSLLPLSGCWRSRSLCE